MSPMLLGMLNTPEIILLLVLALVLFGAKKLPELARGLGHGIKEFRKATRDVQDELNSAMNPPYTPPQPLPPTPDPEPAATESAPPPMAGTAPTDGDQPPQVDQPTEVAPEPPKA